MKRCDNLNLQGTSCTLGVRMFKVVKRPYPVSTRRRFDVHTTSITLKRRRMDVKTTSCAYWENIMTRFLYKPTKLRFSVLVIAFARLHRNDWNSSTLALGAWTDIYFFTVGLYWFLNSYTIKPIRGSLVCSIRKLYWNNTDNLTKGLKPEPFDSIGPPSLIKYSKWDP